MIYSEAEGQW